MSYDDESEGQGRQMEIDKEMLQCIDKKRHGLIDRREGQFTSISEVFPHGLQMGYFLLVLHFRQIGNAFNHIFQINFCVVSCKEQE